MYPTPHHRIVYGTRCEITEINGEIDQFGATERLGAERSCGTSVRVRNRRQAEDFKKGQVLMAPMTRVRKKMARKPDGKLRHRSSNFS
jgi:hypothetical protein